MLNYLKYFIEIVYGLFILYTIFRILLYTHTTSKTLAYLLLLIIHPLIGIGFYFAFGLNYRRSKLTKLGIDSLNEFTKEFRKNIPDKTNEVLNKNAKSLGQYTELVQFIHKIGGEDISYNDFELLINGEEKFPEVLQTLESAKYFIHLEYYAWENDIRGNQIKDVLLRKIDEGVKVRIIFDDYASRKIKKNIVNELRNSGAEIYPAIKVKLFQFVSRLNHRDHRKVIIIDGITGFVGGINISDRYDNSINTGLYWRDTHVKITGPAVLNLQRHFIIHWNYCQPEKLLFNSVLFPQNEPNFKLEDKELAQIVAGVPVFPMSNVMLTYFRIFSLAKEKIYITNPYFIPSVRILEALKEASVSGTDVRLIMPMKSDSAIVGAASEFYYADLLQAGVKIYRYTKGFVHAKTVVADGFVSVVGTTNMDIRSFDLNFEIMSVIYGKNFSHKMEEVFLNDLQDCKMLTIEEWSKNSKFKQLKMAVARLISEFL